MTGAPSLSARFFVRFAALLAPIAVVGVLFAGADAPAPPPKAPDKPARPPEDEDTDAKPITHRVTSDEPDDAGPKALASRAVDLKAAARDAKHFAVKKLFRDLAVPHDVLKYTAFTPKLGNKSVNIAPLPDYIGDNTDAIPEPFSVTPLSEAGAPGDPIKVVRNTVDHITPYEKLALNGVEELSNGKFDQSPDDPQRFLSRYNRDVAQAQALTTVLLRLQSARQTGGRRGDAWQAVEDSLRKKLLDVLLDQLDDRVQTGQWEEAFALTKELAGTYRTPEEQGRIAQPLTDLVKQTLTRSVDDNQKAEARRRLLQLQDLFPNSAAIQPINDALKKQAQDLFDAAQQTQDKAQRERLLNEAKAMWPGLPGLQAYIIKQTNLHTTLRVGVRQLPSRMSPGLASTDSDLRAVELVFESLVKLDPDGAGGARWEPGLAQGRPTMIPRGRLFDLAPNARWFNGQDLTVNDADYTLKQMRADRVPHRPPVWASMLVNLDTAEATSNPRRVPLTLQQGWLDPLALMNFKVLPPGVDPDSPQFAAAPWGSGPYAWQDVRTDEGGRPCVAFAVNPHYGARPGKDKLPRIENVHFIAYNFKDDQDPKADHKEELTKLLADAPGRLDLLLDLTAREAAALQENAAALQIKKVTGRAAPNRRIYFLAVNHEQLHLDNAAFRCALARAINRTKLLDEDFRATPGQDLHSPLNGPYPIRSWAANPKVEMRNDKLVIDPYEPNLARTKLAESRVQGATTTIPLIYPTGDPQTAKAMSDLAAQVKQEIGVTLELKAVPPNELRDLVERDHNYSLAYYHYDFPDDVYWLGPLLDSVNDKKENLLQYQGPLSQMVRDLGRRRDFHDVREWAYRLHDQFLNQEMPFIPLWQLDPLAAVHAEVDTGAVDPPFDPVLVFPDVDRWTVNRK